MTLRGALLGAGNIAQHGHLPAYAQLIGDGTRFQIVAAADLCEENLERVAAVMPRTVTFRDAERLLDEIRPDFVDICAPPFVHQDLVELAIDRGCHILCEKPLSVTLSAATAIAESLRDRSLVFMPGHQYHYAPAWQAIHSVAMSGEIGELVTGSITIERQAANAGNSYWNPRWRTTEALSGGGILMDHGIHLFYQLSSLFGRPSCISAQMDVRRHQSYGVEDTAVCDVQFERGMAHLELTWAADRRSSRHVYMGREGRITCDEASLLIEGRRGNRQVTLDGSFSQDSSHAAWYVPLLDDFLRRIENSNFSRAPLDEAVLSIRLAEAAYESARTGRPVELT